MHLRPRDAHGFAQARNEGGLGALLGDLRAAAHSALRNADAGRVELHRLCHCLALRR